MTEASPLDQESTSLRYGSYRVLHALGRGGMSSVYRAIHEPAHQEVALKVLPARMAKNPVVLQRFLREAQSAESLQHPNIVSIYDRGIDHGRHYLVLEYVPGLDLHEYIQRRGPLQVSEAVRVVRQVASGLDYAARRGMIHRDIKPSNLLRSEAGDIKIIDLGLALMQEHEDERVTREGTTVGTVDYMAPEQARDSRAASVQSDLYSLGCTFYYLLTGVPPFPGGDITDKLSRHAKSPPPDVRDLRPDVPDRLAGLILRLMAKRPEDRFQSHAQLIEALDLLDLDGGTELRGAETVRASPDGGGLGQDRFLEVDLPRSQGVFSEASAAPLPSSIPEISLSNLPRELTEADLQDAARAGREGDLEPGSVRDELRGISSRPSPPFAPALPENRANPAMSAGAWVLLWSLFGAFAFLLVVVVDLATRRSTREPVVAPLNQSSEVHPRGPDKTGSESSAVSGEVAASPVPINLQPAPRTTNWAEAWTEPEDPVELVSREESYPTEVLRSYIPEWAIDPVPAALDGPSVRLRRVAPWRDAVVVPTLRMALDDPRKTIEIEDEGPYHISDFRIYGGERLLHARDGLRAIIRVDRPVLEIVRALPGLVTLEGKDLTLRSIDLVVNLRDLPRTQTAVFWCSGANLTLKDCSITLLNAGSHPISLVHAEGSRGRGSRVRLENCLIRGKTASMISLGGGAAEVVLRDSLLWGAGAIVTRSTATPEADHRLSFVGCILGSLGPVLDLRRPEGGSGPLRALRIRAFDSAFGRIQGPGIASVALASEATTPPSAMIDWRGEKNLYSGWIGFLASGSEPTVRVAGLSQMRSTWNGTDSGSLEIMAPWPLTTEPSDLLPPFIEPFVPGHGSVTRRMVVPRPFLLEKTVRRFAAPIVPLPRLLPAAGPADPEVPLNHRLHLKHLFEAGRPPHPFGSLPRETVGQSPAGVEEIVFDASAEPWQGDLGAFLRERASSGPAHLRVIVRGSGTRRCSPVRLPDKSILELVVGPPTKPGEEGLSWSPDPAYAGRSLIESRRGALLLSGLRIRADQQATYESLVSVEEGDLVMYRCQLTAPAGAEQRTPRLVDFVAVSTRPRIEGEDAGFFDPPLDHPTCMILESVLITQGTALRLEMGRGLAVLTQTAIAAGTDSLELIPARVSRARFHSDLVLDRCTLASQANIVRLGSWPGAEPGPDRPWLVHSSHTAFLGSYERRIHPTVLLRADPSALAGGTLFWQGDRDAIEIDAFTALGQDAPPQRPRDVLIQWINFWGANHIRGITGPRSGASLPCIRFYERLKPGAVEPADLILDPGQHLGRTSLDVGADLTRQGISRPRSRGTRP